MKALVQRVSSSSVTVGGEVKGQTDNGFVVLLGVRAGDVEADAKYLAQKTADLRVFPDEADKMNISLFDSGGEALVISQFTLYADTKKGNRPSFVHAGPPELAKQLYEQYVEFLRGILGKSRVKTGVFGAMMSVEIVNDGPVTIELSSDHR